jgi:hypothetical protein
LKKRDKYKPAVNKSVLLFLAGWLWVCVGCVLLILAFSWLREDKNINVYVFAGFGVVLALLVHHFGFLRIVDRNMARILPVNEKQCVFSFISWKSYLLVLVMVVLGAIVRHSVLPKTYVAILYAGIGLALILSSVRYLRFFVKEKWSKCGDEQRPGKFYGSGKK